jgi:hypothetical protein
MNKELIEELRSPCHSPSTEDFENVRTIITRLEKESSVNLSSHERAEFWRSFDRIWPGPNRWDYRLLSVLLGVVFVFAVQFAILLTIDIVPSARSEMQTIKLHFQTLPDLRGLSLLR